MEGATFWIAVYGAALSTISLSIALLAYRLGRRNAILDGPHIEISFIDPRNPERVHFRLAGPRADQWHIRRAYVPRRSGLQLCRKVMGRDSFNGPEIVDAIPQGSFIDRPDSPLVLSAAPSRPLSVVFVLEAKASRSLSRRSVSLIARAE